MTPLGVIGLGIMGRPVAARLLAAGHPVFLHSRSGVPEELVAKGGRPCGSPAEVARAAEVVFTVVTDTAAVEAVLFGPGGAAEGLSPGKVVVDLSSIAPDAAREFARRLAAQGVEMLDAPVSGGDIGAAAGTLTIMVGGSPATFERVRPILAHLGTTITHIGPNGDGQVAKVANQIVVGLTIEAVAEALLFAARAGADPARVRQALLGGFAGSRILEVHGERMLTRRFEPGGRIAIQQKDLDLALTAARRLGLPLPLTARTQQLFSACVAQGGAGWDHSALVRALERLSGFELGAPAGA
ncbi:MAG TPA: 2-hydroxy-3-oxopropionate reductase [Thermodesulfobacteriota bacterium]|nr:2-hydroxy-3-oxopropionate reductase [Thermodesulfobacteriota bacterium]